MADADIACRHCGATKGFFVEVIVTGEGWCDALIEYDEDGKLDVTAEGRLQDVENDVDWITCIGCAECEKRVPERKIDELIGPRYQPKVGDRVTLPDGIDGVIQAVLLPRRLDPRRMDPKTYVLIEGREYTTLDLTPVPPNPAQLDLLEAA